jgi:uncharacterized protein
MTELQGKDLNADENARRQVLIHSPVIAIVGRSDDHYYTSYEVGEYLIARGFAVYNVNPNIEDVDGQPVYANLSEVPGRIDIVNVFRKSQHLPQLVEEAIEVGAKTVWAQVGVMDDDARRTALAAGLNYADDLCIRTEHERLFDDVIEG